jgi:hypothetical protein
MSFTSAHRRCSCRRPITILQLPSQSTSMEYYILTLASFWCRLKWRILERRESSSVRSDSTTVQSGTPNRKHGGRLKRSPIKVQSFFFYACIFRSWPFIIGKLQWNVSGFLIPFRNLQTLTDQAWYLQETYLHPTRSLKLRGFTAHSYDRLGADRANGLYLLHTGQPPLATVIHYCPSKST